MNWYIAKIIFGICLNENKQISQFDEQLRIISARDENEAFLKARMIGVREEDIFLNDENRVVKWQFIDVSELNLLSDLKDGMEIYSCIQEREESERYIYYIQQKAALIEEKFQIISTPIFQQLA
jgi:Domain of unknown function (DUF4288)